MPYAENFRFLHICHVETSEISPYVEKFSIPPQLSYMVSWNFSTWQFFVHEYNSWYSWQISGLFRRTCARSSLSPIFHEGRYNEQKVWQSIWKKTRKDPFSFKPRICDISHVRLQPCSVVIISTTGCCLTDQKGVKTSIRAVTLSVRPWGHHVAMRRQCLETEGILSGAQHFPWRKRTSLWTPWCTIVFLLFQKKTLTPPWLVGWIKALLCCLSFCVQCTMWAVWPSSFWLKVTSKFCCDQLIVDVISTNRGPFER